MRGRPDAPGGQAHNRPTLGIVGIGRVGGALARALYQHHWQISAVYNRSAVSASNLAEAIGTKAVESINEVALHAQLILLTVPDNAIQAVCEQLAIGDLSGRAVVHTSGVTPIETLATARARGAQIGGLHPVWPVARGDMPFPPGSWFGIECDERPLCDWLSDLVDTLGGSAFLLPPGIDRMQYHTATVLLSNYLVTLYAEASALWRRAGIEPKAARSALLGLARAALDNLEWNDPATALTGPLVRGDTATVRAHLNALVGDPELWEVYRTLGHLTLRLVAVRGLSAARIAELHEALAKTSEEMNDANHNIGLSKD